MCTALHPCTSQRLGRASGGLLPTLSTEGMWKDQCEEWPGEGRASDAMREQIQRDTSTGAWLHWSRGKGLLLQLTPTRGPGPEELCAPHTPHMPLQMVKSWLM